MTDLRTHVTADPLKAILRLKCEADEAVGAAKYRLNECGPRGNKSVEQTLDHMRGRSAALGEAVAILHQWMDEIASR